MDSSALEDDGLVLGEWLVGGEELRSAFLKMNQTSFTFSTPGEAARDAAIELVSNNAGTWMDRALQELMIYRKTVPDFIGEEFRQWALARGLPPPHMHNAWGAVMNLAARNGIIVAAHVPPRAMTSAKSHARKSLVWRAP